MIRDSDAAHAVPLPIHSNGFSQPVPICTYHACHSANERDLDNLSEIARRDAGGLHGQYLPEGFVGQILFGNDHHVAMTRAGMLMLSTDFDNKGARCVGSTCNQGPVTVASPATNRKCAPDRVRFRVFKAQTAPRAQVMASRRTLPQLTWSLRPPGSHPSCRALSMPTGTSLHQHW